MAPRSRIRLVSFASALILGAVGLSATPVIAQSGDYVVVTSGGDAIDGAVVTVLYTYSDLAGSAVAAGTTNGKGAWVAERYGDSAIPSGPYQVVVSKPGYGVANIAADFTGSADKIEVTLEPSGTSLTSVNVYGGNVSGIVADGQPCVFYGTVWSVPSVYRSMDCGGSWSPVTVSRDERVEATDSDGLNGISSVERMDYVTASGFPGEVAVASWATSQVQFEVPKGSLIWYSRDFGSTWQSFVSPMNFTRFDWRHAYDEVTGAHMSLLFLSSDTSAEVGLVDMPTGTAGTPVNPTDNSSLIQLDSSVFTGFKYDPTTILAPAVGSRGTCAEDDPANAATIWLAQSTETGVIIDRIDPGSTSQNLSAHYITSVLLPRDRDTGNPQAADTVLFGGPTNDCGMPRSLAVNDEAFDDNTFTGTAVVGLGTANPADNDWVATSYTSPLFDEASKAGMYVDSSASLDYETGDELTKEPTYVDVLSSESGVGPDALNCGEQGGKISGSVAPIIGNDAGGDWANFGSMFMLRSCLVVQVLNDATVNLGSGGTASKVNYGVDQLDSVPAGSALMFTSEGAHSAFGSAFSSGFNLDTDQVVIAGDGAMGFVKAANFLRPSSDGIVKDVAGLGANFHRPLFPNTRGEVEGFRYNQANAGTDLSSGGFALTGLTAPQVKDIAMSPSDPEGIVMGLGMGGGRIVMSTDGGKSFFTISGRGANAVDWWQGVGTQQWVAGDSGQRECLLGAATFSDDYYANTVIGATDDTYAYPNAAVSFGNLSFNNNQPGTVYDCSPPAGFGGETLGLEGFDSRMTAAAGITGSNMVMVGVSESKWNFTEPPTESADSSLSLVRLTQNGEGRPDFADIKSLADDGTWVASTTTNIDGVDYVVAPKLEAPSFAGLQITAMQYCPVGSASEFEDKVLVATSDPQGTRTAGGASGQIYVYGDVASGTPVFERAVTLGADGVDDIRDVKVDCVNGLAVAVVGSSMDDPGNPLRLYESINDLATWTRVRVSATAGLPQGFTGAEAVAIRDAGNGTDEIMVASGSGDLVVTSLSNTGLTTSAQFRTLNDTASGDGYTFAMSPGDIAFPLPLGGIQGVQGAATGPAAKVGISAVGDVSSFFGAGDAALLANGSKPLPSVKVTFNRNSWTDFDQVNLVYGNSGNVGLTTSNVRSTRLSVIGNCRLSGRRITATAGTGPCILVMSLTGNNGFANRTIQRTVALLLADPPPPRLIPRLNVGQSRALPTTTKTVGKSVHWDWATDGFKYEVAPTKSEGACEIRSGRVWALEPGTCVLMATTTGVANYVAAKRVFYEIQVPGRVR